MILPPRWSRSASPGQAMLSVGSTARAMEDASSGSREIPARDAAQARAERISAVLLAYPLPSGRASSRSTARFFPPRDRRSRKVSRALRVLLISPGRESPSPGRAVTRILAYLSMGQDTRQGTPSSVP